MSSVNKRARPLVALVVALVAGLLPACLDPRVDENAKPRAECADCHGGELEGSELHPEWVAAPPYNLAGETEREARGNGAHALHLLPNDRARSVSCAECHLVPDELYTEGHVDTPYPAELIFTGPANAFEAQPFFNPETQSCENTFCHGGYFVGGRPSGGKLTQPQWTDTTGAASECGACHALPPPLPHPVESECSDCHKNIDADRNFLHPELHVDGNVTFYLPGQPRD